MLLRLFFPLLFLFSSNIDALEIPLTLNCTIKGVYEAQWNGRLEKVSTTRPFQFASILEFVGIRTTKKVYGDAEDSEFTVNRKTGAYVSRFFSNEVWKKNILDIGSKEQSFKVLSTSTGGYVHTQYLQIDLHIESIIKPFRLVNGDTVFTGICNGV